MARQPKIKQELKSSLPQDLEELKRLREAAQQHADLQLQIDSLKENQKSIVARQKSEFSYAPAYFKGLAKGVYQGIIGENKLKAAAEAGADLVADIEILRGANNAGTFVIEGDTVKAQYTTGYVHSDSPMDAEGEEYAD